MKIKSIHLKDFKRFKDLTISDLPESAKLVVLVGPNGCGKSSVFDAMNFYARRETPIRLRGGIEYYSKYLSYTENWINDIRNKIEITPHKTIQINDKTFYIRSAYRHVSSFKESTIKKIDEKSYLASRLPRLIDEDKETQTNYARLIWRAANAVLAPENTNRKAGDIAEEITSVVREYIQKVIPDLQLNALEDLESGTGTFTFTKGDSTGYLYENLSSGEKAAFDLLLDMAIKRNTHKNTVYCIDEPESHIGLGVQRNLLKSLFDMLPLESQLWIATHSIGMMREAYNLQRKEPNKVVFLDFYKLDFDKPQEIKPAQMNRTLWRSMHSVALGDLGDFILPKILIICESSPQISFDAECYNKIFASEKPDVLFVSAGGKGQLKDFATVLRNASTGVKVLTLRDKDDLTDAGRQKLITESNRILSRKNIEEYLLDKEVLRKLCEDRNKPDAMRLLQDARGRHIDAKSSVKTVRNAANNVFHEKPVGDNPDDFLRNTMSILITSEMKVYKELKSDIFNE